MTGSIVPVGDRRPLSMRVYVDLRDRIVGGDYAPGDRLPTEAELVRAYAVSRVTVREALRLLQRDGLVIARHGRGHFVGSQPLIREPITELRSVTQLLTSLGYLVETEVLGVRSQPAGGTAGLLDLGPDAVVKRVERLRRSAGDALIYSIDVVPDELFGGTAVDFTGSLIGALTARGVELAYAQATIRAAKVPRTIARAGHVPPSLPWLLLEQVHFDTSERPIIWSRDFHRGDRFEFNVLRRRLRD